MRIITGKLKGRKIKIPEGLGVRPTTDRAKESIYNFIDVRRYFSGKKVLDLFAGSGNLGFEAISRGVEQVTFVELNPDYIAHIERTARDFGVENQIRTRTADVIEFLSGPPIPFDFIFCDPPYDLPRMDGLIDTVLSNGWLTEHGWFILEHDQRHDFSEHEHCFFNRSYGRTIVSIFQVQPVDSEK